MSDNILFISTLIVFVGFAFTFGRSRKNQTIGWTIASIAVSMNVFYCFYYGQIIIGILNTLTLMIDITLAVINFMQYRKTHIGNREKFLNELMNYKIK